MRKTDWSKWSSVSEIVSSVAILLTLVYLAIQTNQISQQTEINTSALLSNSRGQTLEYELWLVENLIENAEIASSLQPPIATFGNLDEIETYKMRNLQIAFFRIRENLWFQYRSGALEFELWEAYKSVLVSSLNSSSPMRRTWDEGVGLHPEFVQEINSLLD
jgi:hypothetical protein